MSHPESEAPGHLGRMHEFLLVPRSGMEPRGFASWCSVTVLTHLAHTQSSLNFYLQECELFLLFFLLACFFSGRKLTKAFMVRMKRGIC